MRFLVSADETGNVKELVCQEGTDTSLKDTIQPELMRSILEPSNHTTVKTRIKHMFVTEKNILVAARIGGVVDLYDLLDRDSEDFGKLLHSHTLDCENGEKPVALCNFEQYGFILVVFESSKLFAINLGDNAAKSVAIELPGRKGEGPQPISAFTPHPHQPGIFAYGGKENDLQVIRLFHSKDLEKVQSNFDKASSWVPKILFQAENEEQDHLGLDIPIWITGILFHNSENKKHFKIVTSTSYGQIRQYDTSVESEPIGSYKVCKNPIISLNFATKEEEEIIVADTHTFVAKLSLVQVDQKAERIVSASAGTFYKPSLKLLGKFSQGGNTGAINSIASSPHSDAIATGGLDRYIRVFDVRTRKMLAKVYMGTQISSVIFIEDDSSLVNNKEADNEAEEKDKDEEFWRKLDNNHEDEKPLLKKRKRRI